ncbi:MAG: hypothetical protein IJU91_01565, partial [Selenomonadaceae bacterium]|nr:hypothetical protein [Selenomonadaceae bacterium]
MLIADVIRVMLLKQHGGIWLDLDTIILSSRAEKMFYRNENFPLTFFGDVDKRSIQRPFSIPYVRNYSRRYHRQK